MLSGHWPDRMRRVASARVTDIRHIAPAAVRDGLFLTAEFEHRVRLWSFADRSLTAELDTILDFGGQRLALCGTETPIIVAGAWERHGICGYAPDGTQLWQRKDLRQPQHISPAAGGTLVVACFDQRPMHVLAAGSGETVATVRAVRRFYDSPFTDIGLGEVYGHVALIDRHDWKVQWKAQIDGFATLSGAAAPDAFAVGGGGGFGRHGWSTSWVSCFSTAGEELWRWACPPEVNCPALAWDDAAAQWLGVLNHVNNEQPDTLVRWSADGHVIGELPLALLADYAFLPGGRHLVTSDGAVRETREGGVLWELPNPDDD
jgi:hypothetical protein